MNSRYITFRSNKVLNNYKKVNFEFLQVVTPSGAERLVDIVKTGVPAEKREEKPETKRDEPTITTELT